METQHSEQKTQGQDAPEVVEKSIEERLDELTQEHMATGFDFYERLKQGKRIDKEEEIQHVEQGKILKSLQQTYNFMIKMGKLQPSKTDTKQFDRGVMDALKKKQGALGTITRDIPKENPKA